MKSPGEKIDDYLNGALPASEVIVFEASLRADPKLAAEVELQRRM
ncbi:MAG: anti-sigma factor RsiW, partial [Neolewinella sp.]